MHVYLSYLSRFVIYMVRSTRILAKAGQFLSCKHSVPLFQDDFTLNLQTFFFFHPSDLLSSNVAEHFKIEFDEAVQTSSF